MISNLFLHNDLQHLKLNSAINNHKQGNYSNAEALYLSFDEVHPDYILVQYLHGILASQTGRQELAKNKIELYLKEHPQDAQAISMLGLVHLELENFEDAKSLFEKALSLNYKSACLYNNLGQTCFKLGHFYKAIDAQNKALTLEPSNDKAYVGIGISFFEVGQLEQAQIALEKAVSITPQNAEAHFFLGNVFRKLEDLEASIRSYKLALNLNPQYLEAAINCGNSYKDQGRTIEALHYYDLALGLDKNHPEANYNKSLVLLNDAQFESGWSLYEWRFKSEEAQNKFVKHAPIESLPIWNGLPLAGHLLLLPEQGIGDQIFFIGMLSDLRSKVEKLTVCADSRLMPLLRRSYPDIAFTDDVSLVDLSQFNAHIHIGSLGQYLRPNAQALSHVMSPYLWANADQSNRLRNNLKKKDRLLCGISWRSKNADHGSAKSLSLNQLENALRLPGFDFVDLQYGDTQGERDAFLQTYGIDILKREEIDNFSDIDGLASLIAACDLVVTVSNTTAHLACALGKPTLILLPQSSAVFWYWQRREMHSPWYPTAVLLRQEAFGGWPQVMQVVCQILEGM